MTPTQLTGLANDHLVNTLIGQKQFLVHTEVCSDLLALITAARNAGFQMEVVSGFRDFQRQAGIWNNKFRGSTLIRDNNSQPLAKETLTETEKLFAILRWSALPGASRHHWGTDFDVMARNLLPENVTLQLEPWEYHTGHQQPFAHWLQLNMSKYGFFLPYGKDLGGVAVEPWHISHYKCAKACLSELTPQLLTDTIRAQDIAGQSVILQHFDTIYHQYITNIARWHQEAM